MNDVLFRKSVSQGYAAIDWFVSACVEDRETFLYVVGAYAVSKQTYKCSHPSGDVGEAVAAVITTFIKRRV